LKKKESEKFRKQKIRSQKREEKKRQELLKNLDITEMDGKGVEKDGFLATAAKSTKQSKKCLSQESHFTKRARLDERRREQRRRQANRSNTFKAAALVQMIIGVTLFPSLTETKEGWINTVCEVVEQHISLESRQLICVANKEKVHFKD
jgi:hypothetical protein